MLSRNRIGYLRGTALLAACACIAAAQPVVTQPIAGIGKNLGEAFRLRSEGRYSEAQGIFAELRREAERDQPGTGALAQALDCEALNEQAMGHYLEAERLLHRALAILAKVADDSTVAVAKTHLAELYLEERRPRDAEPLLREAAGNLSGLSLATSLEDLAVVDVWKQKYSEAEQLLRRALNLTEAELGGRDPLLTGSLQPLALVLTLEHRGDEAVELAERAWRIVQAASRPVPPPDRACTLNALAVIYLRAGRPRQALPYAQESLAIAEQLFGPAQPKLAFYLQTNAAVLKQSGQKREAKAMEQRAQAIRVQSARDNPARLTVSVSSLR
jgi:tetratricopeptide (TPR) repeat protein